jgi:hypothetical protein
MPRKKKVPAVQIPQDFAIDVIKKLLADAKALEASIKSMQPQMTNEKSQRCLENAAGDVRGTIKWLNAAWNHEL